MNSSIISAVRGNDLPSLLAFLKSGGDPNLRDEEGHGETLLIIAIANTARLEICEALVQAGADVNARDFLDYTALHLVLTEDHARWLLKRGADPYLKNNLKRAAYEPRFLDDTLAPSLLTMKAELEAEELERELSGEYGERPRTTI